jgi:hypothetical protein
VPRRYEPNEVLARLGSRITRADGDMRSLPGLYDQ